MRPLTINWWPHLLSCFPVSKHLFAVHSIAISSNSGSRITRFLSFIRANSQMITGTNTVQVPVKLLTG